MEKTVPNVLAEYVQSCPDHIAIILQINGQQDKTITYRDLLDGAARYAQVFSDNKIATGEVIIFILQHSEDLIYAFFGAILHGAIPSIMPFLTEKLLPERYRGDLASLIAITQPSAIVTYPEFEEAVRGALQKGDSVRAVILTTSVPDRARISPQEMIDQSCKAKDIVLLQHSSGTTGLQKGVALSHQAIFNQLTSYSKAIQLKNSDVIISWLPLYHDMGLIAGFLQPILSKIPLVLMSPFDWVRAPYKLFHAASKYKGTISWLPNFAFNFCAQKIRDRHLEGVDLSTWRAIINCSEPVRYESHQKFYDRFKNYGLRFDALCTSYAMAENVFGVTQSGIDRPVMVDKISREKFQFDRIAVPVEVSQHNDGILNMLSCGAPIQGTEILILDAEGNPVPERHVGEVAIRSNCMLTGYYNRPEETKKAMNHGWYMTGDYGYIANGELFVSGRKKDLIIVAGKNVYPQDLETLAMEVDGVHPGRVVAFGIYNEDAGTEDVVIVAEVDSADPLVKERISDEIRNQVTRGSAVALRYVYLVNGQWLIKTSSGKTARAANKEKYLSENLEFTGG
jgi:fatty-acyl-CoA synthase